MTALTVIGEFAINPECVCTLADLKDLEKRFGFRHGAVISEFPRTWIAEVKERAQQLEEPTRSAFRERVTRLKELAMVRMGRTGDGANWLERTLNSHAAKPFYAIFHKKGEGECRCFQEALEDDSLFEPLREAKVARNALDLVRAVEPVVRGSERFALIDPYFAPDRYYKQFVEELIRTATEVTKRRLYIDIHLEYRGNVREGEVPAIAACDIAAFKNWVDGLGAQITVTVSWWLDCGNGELHPRYLITERAGVRYDRGFKIPPDLDQQSHDTDVTMMTDAMTREVESRYSTSYVPLRRLHREEYIK